MTKLRDVAVLLLLVWSASSSSQGSNNNNCTLCQDGSNVPFPLLEVLPGGTTCAALSIDARRDDPENCIYHQGVVGTYCGCTNNNTNVVGVVCRLCSDERLLPDPLRVVDQRSCIQHEFRGSLHQNCSAHQALYSTDCCLDDIPSASPSLSPTTTRMPPTTTTQAAPSTIPPSSSGCAPRPGNHVLFVIVISTICCCFTSQRLLR